MKWSLDPNKNSEGPPCQIPDFSSCLSILAFIGIFSCGSLLSEEEDGIVISIDDKIKRLEQNLGIYTPPERTTFNVFGQFLYAKASLDGAPYATTAILKAAPDGVFVYDHFKTRSVHFEYSPGFQIGVGIGLPHDQWDIEGQWLHFHTTGNDKAHADQHIQVGNKAIFDGIGSIQSIVEGFDISPTQSKAKCHLKLDVVDAVLGRIFLWSRYFGFHPFIGIRTSWTDLNWNISYKMPIVIPSAFPQALSDLKIRNHFIGVGFVGGFDLRWNVYRGFGFFSRGAASLIYGNSCEKTQQKFSIIPEGQSSVFKQTLTAEHSMDVVTGIFDIALGLKWDKKIYKHNRVLLWVGYDFFYWPSAVQKTRDQVTFARDRIDMSFEGLILGARFDF